MDRLLKGLMQQYQGEVLVRHICRDSTAIEARQRVTLIEPNRRRLETVPALDPVHQERYKVRTVGERTYSHLKDSLIPAKLYVRGFAKVKFHLFCGVVCLTALKILTDAGMVVLR